MSCLCLCYISHGCHVYVVQRLWSDRERLVVSFLIQGTEFVFLWKQQKVRIKEPFCFGDTCKLTIWICVTPFMHTLVEFVWFTHNLSKLRPQQRHSWSQFHIHCSSFRILLLFLVHLCHACLFLQVSFPLRSNSVFQ